MEYTYHCIYYVNTHMHVHIYVCRYILPFGSVTAVSPVCQVVIHHQAWLGEQTRPGTGLHEESVQLFFHDAPIRCYMESEKYAEPQVRGSFISNVEIDTQRTSAIQCVNIVNWSG